jgi:hypothetical protein
MMNHLGRQHDFKFRNRLRIASTAIVASLFLTSCGGSEQSLQQSSIPLTFALLENGKVPYMCQEVFQRGTLCTLDILFENTGTKVFDYDLSAEAVDKLGRTFKPQNDPSIPEITIGGASFINPGEQLDWSLEFPVAKGTHLTSVNIYHSELLVATVDINLQS